MRATLHKQISDLDYGRAQIIAEKLWEHTSLGDAQLARMLGFEWITYEQKMNSRDRIRNLMGTAVRIMAMKHPGFTIHRPGGGLAQVVDDPDTAIGIVLPRLYKMVTIAERLDAECSPLRHSTNPTQHEIAAGVRMCLASMERALEDAVHKESERFQFDDAP